MSYFEKVLGRDRQINRETGTQVTGEAELYQTLSISCSLASCSCRNSGKDTFQMSVVAGNGVGCDQGGDKKNISESGWRRGEGEWVRWKWGGGAL